MAKLITENDLKTIQEKAGASFWSVVINELNNMGIRIKVSGPNTDPMVEELHTRVTEHIIRDFIYYNTDAQ